MSDFLSASARKRLPAAIRELPEKEQAVFVLLRMKRDEVKIARELSVDIPEARRLIRNVQNALIKSGTLDLIQDPVFFPIDHPPDKGRGPAGGAFEPGSGEMEMDDRLALERFYKILEQSISELPKNERRLLRLWFNEDMRAKDILNFYKNIGAPISSGKSIHKTTERDVFYALGKNIRNLLDIVRTHIKQEDMDITPSILRAILEETGV